MGEKPFRASAKNDDNDDEARVPVSLCTLAFPAKPKKISDFYFFCLSVEICRGKYPEGYEGLKEGREVGSVRGKEVLHHTALLAFVSASLGCLSAPSRPHRKDGRTFRGMGSPERRSLEERRRKDEERVSRAWGRGEARGSGNCSEASRRRAASAPTWAPSRGSERGRSTWRTTSPRARTSS